MKEIPCNYLINHKGNPKKQTKIFSHRYIELSQKANALSSFLNRYELFVPIQRGSH